jgi:hypothetical protein
MNKNGMTELLLLTSIFGFLATAQVVAAVTLTPSHRIRKAEQKCVFFGKTANVCKAEVAAMTKAQRLAYIRDTQESPSYVWDK